MKIKINIILIGIILIPVAFVSAHPGNTDRQGGHTCYTNCTSWGLYYGQYHYHNSPKIIPPTQTTSNNTQSGWHGINYQGDCYSYELSVSEYDEKANEYFSSKEYINEKEIWRKKLETKDGNFWKVVSGSDYKSFLWVYEFTNRYMTTNLDDTYCFKPLEKLSEYANSEIQVYNKEQGSLKNRIKRWFSF